MNWREDYRRKLRKAEDVAALVKSGDRINLGGGQNWPREFCLELSKRIEELDNILLGVGLSWNLYNFMKPDINQGRFTIETTFPGPLDRICMKWGTAKYVPVHLSQLYLYGINRKFNITGFAVTAPDENGFVNRTAGAAFVPNEVIKNADVVFVEIIPDAHWLNGDDFKLHISEIDYIIETNNHVAELPPIEITEIERTIGSHIVDLVPDGSTIQMGFGGLADAIGYFLKDKKNLSIYAETFTSSMAELCKSGAVNGANNPEIPGIAMASFGFGSNDMHRFVDRNKDLLFRELKYLNNPLNIAKNRNLVGINSSICVDLTGQACSESVGTMQYSGTGGQVDFSRGIAMAENSRSFLALESVHIAKDGTRTSKIDLTLPAGSVVTTPRTDVDCIVTEYGVANLKHKNLTQRANELIKIAHPDFRDELKFKVKQAGL